MEKDHFHNWLLAAGAGAGTAWKIFESVSEVCRIMLPILSVISFTVYIALNWKKLKELRNKKPTP